MPGIPSTAQGQAVIARAAASCVWAPAFPGKLGFKSGLIFDLLHVASSKEATNLSPIYQAIYLTYAASRVRYRFSDLSCRNGAHFFR